MAPTEIERKFRPRTDGASWKPHVIGSSSWDVLQGYLSMQTAGVEVRLRRSRLVLNHTAHDVQPVSATGDRGGPVIVHRLGIKTDQEADAQRGIARVEVEPAITSEEFNALWPATEGRRLRKVRVNHLVDLPLVGPRNLSVDYFKDALGGLVLIEIEFDGDEQAEAFEPPAFLGEEVTFDPRYRNANLAEASGLPLA